VVLVNKALIIAYKATNNYCTQYFKKANRIKLETSFHKRNSNTVQHNSWPDLDRLLCLFSENRTIYTAKNGAL